MFTTLRCIIFFSGNECYFSSCLGPVEGKKSLLFVIFFVRLFSNVKVFIANLVVLISDLFSFSYKKVFSIVTKLNHTLQRFLVL